MSKRPEAVKCENCCYWGPPDTVNGATVGGCHRYPPSAVVDDDPFERVSVDAEETMWCGEFSAEWPKPELTYPGSLPWHGQPAGEDLRRGDLVELRDGKWFKVNAEPADPRCYLKRPERKPGAHPEEEG